MVSLKVRPLLALVALVAALALVGGAAAQATAKATRIPGQPDRAMRFTPHGRTADAPWFWATRWDVPLDYPLGIVDFQIIVRTKKVDGKKPKTAVFTQPNVFGIGLGKLEIVESRPDETPAAPGR